MKINKALRYSIEKAEYKILKARMAVEAISRYIKFEGFDENDEPNLNIASEDDIILEWHGDEKNRNDIIWLMENKGCITPDDFLVN